MTSDYVESSLVTNMVQLNLLLPEEKRALLESRLPYVGYEFCVYEHAPSQLELSKARYNLKLSEAKVQEAWQSLSREELQSKLQDFIGKPVLFEHLDNLVDTPVPRETPRLTRGQIAQARMDAKGSVFVVIRPFQDWNGLRLCSDIEILGYRECSLYHERIGDQIFIIEVSICAKGLRPNTTLRRVLLYKEPMSGESYVYKYEGVLRRSVGVSVKASAHSSSRPVFEMSSAVSEAGRGRKLVSEMEARARLAK